MNTMTTRTATGLLALMLLLPTTLLSTGCTIPSDCGDMDYPTYGGAWQRTRRDSGRVGSVFDPAGARTATLSPRELPENDERSRTERDSIFSSPGAVPDQLDSQRNDDDPFRQRRDTPPQGRDAAEDETTPIRYQHRQASY